MLDKLSFGPVLLTLAEKAAALKVDTSRWRQLDSLQDQGRLHTRLFLLFASSYAVQALEWTWKLG